jgi:hypothetical protein
LFFPALHWAANNGHLDILLVLLKAGADKNSRTNDKKLAVDLTKNETIKIALEAKDLELFEMLHKLGLDSYVKKLTEEDVSHKVLLTLSGSFSFFFFLIFAEKYNRTRFERVGIHSRSKETASASIT